MRSRNVGSAFKFGVLTGTGAATDSVVIAAPTDSRIFIDSIMYSNDTSADVSMSDSGSQTVLPTVYLGSRGGLVIDSFEFPCGRETSLRITVSAGNWSVLVKYQLDAEL
jgi:hypothetical protein